MADYDMVMPFVTVASKGGPHDDASYCAGWECGTIDGELRTIDVEAGVPIAKTVHTENLAQLDLVAMAHGFTMRTMGDQPGEWTHVEFRWGGNRG